MKTTLCLFQILLLSLFICINALSQSPAGSTLKGIVIIKEGKPASYVTIELKRQKLKSVADKNGKFSLEKLPMLNDTLIIKGIGFTTYKQFIHIDTAQNLDMGIIHLEYSIVQLREVEVKGFIPSYKNDSSFSPTKIQTALGDVPQSVSTVTKELIKDKNGMQLTDVLDDAAGVNHYSGYDEFTIRGFRAENPHLINGLRTYNASLTSPMLVNIERVEIIKGPTSVLYGNADPGGTINMVTKKPLTENALQVDLSKGSWNGNCFQGDVTGAVNKTKKILYRFSTGYKNEESFRNQFFAKSFQLAPSFSFIPNNKIQLNLDVSVSHINTVVDRGQPGYKNDYTLRSTPIGLMVTQPGDYLKENNIASIISFSYKLNNHLTFNSAYLNYITNQSLSEHGINDFITDDSVYLYYTNRHVNTVTNTITNYFTFRFNTGKFSHQLLAGYDFIKSNFDFTQWKGGLPDIFGEGSGIVGTFSLKNPQYSARAVDDYEHSTKEEDFDADAYYTQGIYIQEELSLSKWKLLASLRKEFYTSTGDDSIKQNVILPRVGVVFSASENIHLYATYNMGFDPFETSPNVQIFNAPFKPIYSEMLEAGTKANFLKNKFSVTFALYQITLKNVAVNANDPGNPDLYTQRGQEQSSGFETEAYGNILPNLSVYLSYAYNVAKILKSDKPEEKGNIKENAPRNLSGSYIKYTFLNGFLKGFTISAGHSQAGMRSTLDTNLKLPGYCILNTGIQYTKRHFNIAMNINNVANKTYWSAAYNNINKWPGAPRNYIIRVGYNF